MKTLEDLFRAPPSGYGEVPFWWWTGEKLDKERIAWQLRELRAKGVSGTQVNYAHLMTHGWATVPVEPPIFSDEWWDVFAFAAEESARLGMGIGLSGYTLDWPGCDNLYRHLGIETDETRGRVLELRDGKVVPVVRDGTLDPLNPESARRVIERFFKPFWERVPESARGALNYFFQDELRLSGNAYVWSDDFPVEFRKRKGYDIVPELPLLFADKVTDDVARVHLDYNDVMVALTEERYFKPIYDFHASRGKIYACDPATRGRNPIEFGDYMRSMRWYTAPGFDTPGGKADPVKCKMGSSIAHLYRRPRVWLEGYHSQGWQANTASIFDATAHNFVWGANLLNLHGLYYSTYGGWWEWAPPCYHFHQPYWALMGTTLKYFERLAYMLTRGVHVADVAILSPQEPCVIDFERAKATSVPLAHALVERLAVSGTTDCDFIDSDSVLAAAIERDTDGAALAVAGERYRVVLLPDMFAIRPAVREKLDAFAARGGRVVEVKDVDDVKLPLVPQPDVVGNAGLKYHHRRLDNCDIYYLVDWDGQTEIRLRARGVVEYWDLWTGGKLTAPRAGEPLLVVVRRGGGNAVVPALKTPVKTEQLPIEGNWRVSFTPTLDNRWGDYRLPAFDAMIGPEVRAMRWIEEDRVENLGFGPQFLTASNQPPPNSSTANSQLFNFSTFQLFNFSWRYGVFDKPGNQDNYHGLNRKVTDLFFVMGPYSQKGYYDMEPPDHDRSLRTTYTTFVHAPADLEAQIIAEAEPPWALSEDSQKRWEPPSIVSLKVGDEDVQPGARVALKAGYTPVEVQYEGYGRAALVFVATSPSSQADNAPQELPLAMRWNAMPGRLSYDPFGGKYKTGTFVATVPPGTVDAVVDVRGKLLKKEIRGGVLTLEIAFEPGFVGGNAFNDAVKLVTEPADMALGDWAQWEGLRCYSGGATYSKTVEVPAAFRKDAARIVLDLGDVGCAAEVAVNGNIVGTRTCPPWTVDVTDALQDGPNDFAVTVYNTLNNHCQTIPTRYKVTTEKAPSGLLGPMALVVEKRAEQRKITKPLFML
ncbi:MAG: hypothetical protein IJQ73_07940 [Kiritimatiellae bacterium]|nr:hypothetical protein [Kiritimatiellia bacterium]